MVEGQVFSIKGGLNPYMGKVVCVSILQNSRGPQYTSNHLPKCVPQHSACAFKCEKFRFHITVLKTSP